MIFKFLISVFFIINIFYVLNISYALTPISSCGTYGVDNEIYNLTQNISSSSNCISFSAVTNSILNCNNFLIEGNFTGDGIRYISSSENISIRNCNVKNFDVGLSMVGDDSYIINSSFYNNTDDGIYSSGDSNTFTTLLIYDNLGNGIFMSSSADSNEIINSTVYNNNKSGLSIIGPSNTISNIISYNNTEHGIYVFGNNNLFNNLDSYGNLNGLNVDRASNIQVNNCNFSNNYQASLSFFTNFLPDCSMRLTSVYGNNKPIFFFNSSVNITNWNNNNISELILCNADNSIISGLTLISSNPGQGSLLQMTLTDNSIFSDLNLRNGFYGLVVYYPSNNSFFSSTFYGNSEFGVRYFGNGGLKNLFLNNTFFNDNNIGFVSTTQVDKWNTSTYGNTWLNISGFGFSQTCIDSGEDNICDTSYTISGSNIDYFPYIYNQPSNEITSLFSFGFGVITIVILVGYFLLF